MASRKMRFSVLPYFVFTLGQVLDSPCASTDHCAPDVQTVQEILVPYASPGFGGVEVDDVSLIRIRHAAHSEADGFPARSAACRSHLRGFKLMNSPTDVSEIKVIRDELFSVQHNLHINIGKLYTRIGPIDVYTGGDGGRDSVVTYNCGYSAHELTFDASKDGLHYIFNVTSPDCCVSPPPHVTTPAVSKAVAAGTLKEAKVEQSVKTATPASQAGSHQAVVMPSASGGSLHKSTNNDPCRGNRDIILGDELPMSTFTDSNGVKHLRRQGASTNYATWVNGTGTGIGTDWWMTSGNATSGGGWYFRITYHCHSTCSPDTYQASYDNVCVNGGVNCVNKYNTIEVHSMTCCQPNITTCQPTSVPTAAPTRVPTKAPTAAPTFAPSAVPTKAPTHAPTAAPTHAPTAAPTAAPTPAPTVPACRMERLIPKGGGDTGWWKIIPGANGTILSNRNKNLGTWYSSNGPIDIYVFPDQGVQGQISVVTYSCQNSVHDTYSVEMRVDELNMFFVNSQYCCPTQAPTRAPTQAPTTAAPTKAPTKAPTAAPTSPTPTPTPAPYCPRSVLTSWNIVHDGSPPTVDQYQLTLASNGHDPSQLTMTSGTSTITAALASHLGQVDIYNVGGNSAPTRKYQVTYECFSFTDANHSTAVLRRVETVNQIPTTFMTVLTSSTACCR
eukprot:gnl/TRDRNA2_/TRDRNA2_81710_c0_seq1.p1 gnl/TRDRNA2_/TRDRNA2_81710_c0~~gnl/TRDRNA2_/TRDRNA2_81710_c0_seq1.p1  ORF type:complete len:671 (-),score=27.61 gnl/TRDRNA2_/TRDRNA2_81710_c0_seq1:50-2062(-)